MVGLDVLGTAGVNKYSKRKGVINAEGHGFSAAQYRHDQCLLLMAKSVTACLMTLDV
jgi:hypothetical protein